MKEKNVEKYKALLELEPPEPKGRVRMNREKRAAQFMPFAALTGFGDGIAEESRLQEERMRS